MKSQLLDELQLKRKDKSRDNPTNPRQSGEEKDDEGEVNLLAGFEKGHNGEAEEKAN